LDLEPPFNAAWDPVPRRHFEETIVMVHTNEGLTGYAGGAPLPDRDLLESLLRGVDPIELDRVASICQTVDFHGGRPWTVEVAFWDLVGRIEGQPLHRLLGGERTEFLVYASCGERVPPEVRVERVLALRDEGISAAKLRFHAADWKDDMPVLEAVRDAVGTSMELMVDANQGWRMPGDVAPRWSFETALDCARALSELDVYWLEEPLDTAQFENYRRLREQSDVPLAAGEMVRSLSESRQLAEVVDVIQNDVVLAGGIAGCREIAAAALELGTVWSPHTWSTGYGLLANLHPALAFSTGPYLEYPFDPPGWSIERRDFMLPAPLELTRGTLVAPSEPGLGMTPDLAYLERFRIG